MKPHWCNAAVETFSKTTEYSSDAHLIQKIFKNIFQIPDTVNVFSCIYISVEPQIVLECWLYAFIMIMVLSVAIDIFTDGGESLSGGVYYEW